MVRRTAFPDEVRFTPLPLCLGSDVQLRVTVTPHNALRFLRNYVLRRPKSKHRAAKHRHVKEHHDHRAAAEVPVDGEGGNDEELATGISAEEAKTRLSEADAGALRNSPHYAQHHAFPSSASAAPLLESLKNSQRFAFGSAS